MKASAPAERCFDVTVFILSKVKYRNNENKSKQHEIFFWINWTKIYTKSEDLAKCCQLHRLACQEVYRILTNWNICLTVVTLWICLRFRNIEIKYFRKVSIFILKYCLTLDLSCTVELGTLYFFMFVSAFKLVSLADLVEF